MWKYFPCGLTADASLMGDGREEQDGKGQKDPCRSTRCTIDSPSFNLSAGQKRLNQRDRKLWTLF
jgi:hypothetical protein